MKIKIIFVLLIIGILNFCFSKIDTRVNPGEIKANYKFVATFLSSHEESNFLLIQSFLLSPKKYFNKIKRIENIFSYMEIFDRLAEENIKYRHLGFNYFIENKFQSKITKKGTEIILYLILNSDGYFGEILADSFQKMFSIETSLMLTVLAKETNWQKVVDSLGSSDWEALKKTVIPLQDSGFQGEFKKYVLSKGG
jgi:hypothetical protein